MHVYYYLVCATDSSPKYLVDFGTGFFTRSPSDTSSDPGVIPPTAGGSSTGSPKISSSPSHTLSQDSGMQG